MYHLWDSRVENELRTIIRGCDRVSLLSLSGQLIPGGIQQVCSVLKNHKSHPRNFPSLQNPFSSSLFGSSSPPFFCRRTIVTTHVFCFSSFFFLFFFLFLPLIFCGERGHFATSSTRTLFLYSSVCRWNGNNDKTATSVSHVKRWSLLLWTTGAQFGTFS